MRRKVGRTFGNTGPMSASVPSRPVDRSEPIHPPRGMLDRLQLLAGLMREAPPAPVPGPRLLWRDGGGRVRALALGRDTAVGRDPAGEVVLDAPRVSRRHCVVRRGDPACEVEDLGSANGTFVNGVRVQRLLLNDGDVIEAGGCVLALAYG